MTCLLSIFLYGFEISRAFSVRKVWHKSVVKFKTLKNRSQSNFYFPLGGMPSRTFAILKCFSLASCFKTCIGKLCGSSSFYLTAISKIKEF